MNRLAPVLLTLAALAAVLPLALPGMWQGHDLLFEVVRGAQYDVALRTQGFPPRLAPDLAQGYGYPIFVFFPHTFLLLSTLLARLVGWSLAAELVLGGAVLVGAAGMVVLARRFLALPSALFAGAVWLAAPYLAYDVYARSAFTETVGICLLPWVCWAALVLVDANSRVALRLAAIAIGAVFVCSHNLTVLLALPVLAALVSARCLQRRSIRCLAWPLFAVAAVAALTAFYTVPIVAGRGELSMTWDPMGPFGVLRHALWSDVAGGGGSVAEKRAWCWLAAVGAVTGALALRTGDRSARMLAAGLLVVAAVQLWLATTWSAAVWQALPALAMVQFPSRFLGHAVVPVALLAGLAASVPLRHRAGEPARLVLATAAIAAAWTALPFADMGRVDVATLPTDPAFVRQAHVTTTVADEFLPPTVTRRPTVPAEPTFGFSLPDAELVELRPSGLARAAVLTTAARGTLLVRRFAVAGWVLTINGERAAPELTSFGTMRVDLDPGRYDIALQWRAPAHRTAANAVSAVSWSIWLVGLGAALWAVVRRRAAPAVEG